MAPVSEFITLKDTDEPQMKMVRFRTLGDITITGGQESDADTLEKIIQEVASSRQTDAVIAKTTSAVKALWKTENVKVTSNHQSNKNDGKQFRRRIFRYGTASLHYCR